MEYSITSKNHLFLIKKNSWYFIILFIIVMLVGIFDNFENAFIYIMGIFLSINLCSVLFLHIQYYIINRNQTLIVCHDSFEIINTRNNSSKIIKFSEIKILEVHMTPNTYRGTSDLKLPFEQYSYAAIYIPNERHIITRLLVNDLFKVLEDTGIKIYIVKDFYPYVD